MEPILSPCHGAVLTLPCGTPDYPRWLSVDTALSEGASVNGHPVDRHGHATVPVSGHAPVLTLRDETGKTVEENTLRFAPRLYKKYRFTIDDNIRFLEDLNANRDRYASIFENPYLAGLKKLHERFGLKVTLNLFYSYTPDSFSLHDMTDRYKEEFLANAHWMRFTFHARHNDPGDPYEGKPAEVILKDFDDVMHEIVRFAGRKCISDFMTVHYFQCTREACLALQKRGVRGFMGAAHSFNDEAAFTGYLNGDDIFKMEAISLWQDPDTDLYFIRNDMIINKFPLETIVPSLTAVKRSCSMDKNGTGYFDVMIHEQYFYEDFEAYQPDFFQKLFTVFSWLENEGYSSIFLDDEL